MNKKIKSKSKFASHKSVKEFKSKKMGTNKLGFDFTLPLPMKCSVVDK